MRLTEPLAPGATIGILGGGQLGRMTAMAAARLGYRCAVFAPESECVGAEVCEHWLQAAYDDHAQLQRFSQLCDVITIEFENVPVETLAFLAERCPTGPSAAVLAVTQDRWAEKQCVSDLGFGIADSCPIDNLDQLDRAMSNSARGAILKTRRLGYDGKGQVRLTAQSDFAHAFDDIGRKPAVLEQLVEFEREISVIVARGWDGNTAAYTPVENAHLNGILDRTTAPAPIAASVANEAVRIATAIATTLDVVGILAIEMFLMPNGQLLVNEMAPRPHNSGHWTIDACAVSQFEQLVRAICALPLGDTSNYRPAVMQNLIGDAVHDWPTWLSDQGARLHIYGKKDARPGRKMGHVTKVF